MNDISNIITITPKADASRHEQAWSHLFQSLAIILEESSKPNFQRLAFNDSADNRVWSMPALIREADRRMNIIRIQGNKPL